MLGIETKDTKRGLSARCSIKQPRYTAMFREGASEFLEPKE